MTSFWRGRRVFVTGHTGFKGAWLCLWLRHLGAEVTAYALDPPTDPSLFVLAAAGQGIRDLRGDVLDLAALSKSLREAGPEVVIHMAAQALVRTGYTDPVGTFSTNVMGTVHLLEAARECPGVKALLIVTSDKCYENRNRARGYREDDAMGGRDPYSASKGCAELATSAYHRSFFAEGVPQVAAARAGNVIGGGDWAPDRLVPDLIRAFGEGRPALIRNPAAIRPWQHVLEPLHGYLLLAERLCDGDPQACGGWNFGPEESGQFPVSELATRAAELWGSGARWEVDPGDHPHEALTLVLDARKACDQLGWRPRLSAEQTFEWTVRWYRGLREGRSARDLSMGDIMAYEDLLPGREA